MQNKLPDAITIKRFTISSDDCGALTANELNNMQTTHAASTLPNIDLIKNWTPDDNLTHALEQFTDNEYYGIAYDLGYETFMSMNDNNEANEIVYLIKRR